MFRMNTPRIVRTLSFWGLVAAGPCFALVELADVSAKEAKEMGISLRSHANGENGIAVDVAFKPEGKLQHFSFLKLSIHDAGKKLAVDVLIHTDRDPGGTITGRFSSARTSAISFA